MDTETIVRPKLQHYGLTTSNLDAMTDWYSKVLGMEINFRTPAPTGPQNGLKFRGAFATNDEVHHRIVFIEVPGLGVDPEKARHARVQHVAFEYATLDELLATYLRLKGLGILPVVAADQGLQTAFYYEDPDQNLVELNINNYEHETLATDYMRESRSFPNRPRRVYVDPEKLVEAREAGLSPWQVHERAFAGEFEPTQTYDPNTPL